MSLCALASIGKDKASPMVSAFNFIGLFSNVDEKKILNFGFAVKITENVTNRANVLRHVNTALLL